MKRFSMVLMMLSMLFILCSCEGYGDYVESRTQNIQNSDFEDMLMVTGKRGNTRNFKTGDEENINDDSSSQADEGALADKPVLSGKVVYHNYKSYGDGSSQIFTLDFKTNKVSCLSSGWTNVRDPMNAVWSPDGKSIVFMGIDISNGSWDLYSYVIGSKNDPINLTNSAESRDEDPKFFPGSSTQLVYKSTKGGIASINIFSLSDNSSSTIYSSTEMECSMPYLSHDGSTVYFSALLSSGETDIYSVPVKGGRAKKVSGCAESGVTEYYPVTKDESGFFFARNTTKDPADMIYFKNIQTGSTSPAAFNIQGYDTSDPCIVSPNYTIVSSTRRGGAGGYDLYICDNTTGRARSLGQYNANINSNKNELGACYIGI